MKRNAKQKLLLAALICAAISTAMLIGFELGMATSAFELFEPAEYWITGGFALVYGLLVIGLFRPEKWKKMLALSIFLQCGLWWVWYGIELGSFLYALMSFPINIIAEVLLISYILSTKRGKALRIWTGVFLEFRVMEVVTNILASVYYSVGLQGVPLVQEETASPTRERYLVYGLCLVTAVLLKYLALALLVHGLDRKEDREPEESPVRLERGFFAAAGREKMEKLCLACGGSNPWEERLCSACGKELKEEAALFENFPDENSLSPVLRNAYDSLKKQDWASAKESCEKLIENGENSPWAYIGMLLADLQYESFAELWNRPLRLELHGLWQKAMGAAEGETKERLKKIRRSCFNLCEQQRLEKQYAEALELRRAETVEKSVASAKGFARISGYRDAEEQAGISLRQAQELTYHAALEEEQAENWSRAQQLYESVPEWKDAPQRKNVCQKMLKRMESGLWNCGIGTKLGIGAACFVSALVFFLIFRI